MVAPVGTNFECTAPLMSLKTVSMMLPADSVVFNFFGACEPYDVGVHPLVMVSIDCLLF
jgi:hypothetical protein